MTTANWFPVETRPRAELTAQTDITSMGLEAYVPQEIRLRRTRRGAVPVQHTLMPGFVFVRAAPSAIFDVLKSKAVRNVIRAPGGAALPIRAKIVDGWPVHFVDEMRRREAAGDFDFTPKRKPLVKGGHARVIAGFFKDQIGRLLSAPTEERAEIMMTGLFNGRMTVDVRGLEGVEQTAAMV